MHQKQMVWVLVLACGLVFVTSGWLGASPSGLNNIPTVDVTPRNVLVLQGWGDFAHGASPVYLARLSLGYSFQENDQAFFAGLDKTLELQSRDLILRADVRQVDDGDEWLASAGFLHVLPLNLVLESWVSIPSARDAEEALTVKLNYVIAF